MELKIKLKMILAVIHFCYEDVVIVLDCKDRRSRNFTQPLPVAAWV